MLTNVEVDEFREQGFLFIDRPVLAVPDVLRVRQILDALFEDWSHLPRRLAPGTVAPSGGPPAVSEIKRAMALAPELVRSALVAECRAVACELLEVGRVWCHFDHAIYKSPGSGPVGWHQDRAMSSTGSLERAVHFWIPLHDVDLESGGMMFVPLAQAPDLLPHEREERSQGVMTKVARLATAVQGVAKALSVGGLSIHGPRTLHSSAPNNGPAVRKAWILQFGVGPWAAARQLSLRAVSVRLGTRRAS
jgi:hypothetical protein